MIVAGFICSSSFFRHIRTNEKQYSVDKGSHHSKSNSVYATRVRAGRRRTYFFDVKQTKGKDYYITLTESTRRHDGDGYERHKLFLYKEDFNRFLAGLEETIDYIKTELLPDYDYGEFDRRHAENDAAATPGDNA